MRSSPLAPLVVERTVDPLLAVAAFGLPDRTPPDAASPPVTVPQHEWAAWIGRVRWHRLTGIAVAAVEAGVLAVPERRREELLAHQREDMLWSLRLDARLATLCSTLRSAGVEVVVLKGAALAYGRYPDPSWRPYADIDLLVRAVDLPVAARMLSSLGMRRSLPEPRPGYDGRFGKAVVYRSEDGVEVDVHRTLAAGAFGLWIDADELSASAEVFSVGGTALRRLDATDALLHACLHAVLGDAELRLLSIRDVAQLASTHDIDWERFGDRARRWRASSVVRLAFARANRWLGSGCVPTGLELHDDDRAARRALSLYLDRRYSGAEVRTMIAALPTLRAKAAYVAALVVPGREFLSARLGGGGSYVGRWTVPLRWLGGSARRRRVAHAVEGRRYR